MAITLSDLAAAAVPGGEAVLAACAPLMPRLGGVAVARLVAGLAAAPDPVAALHGLARLLDLGPMPASLPVEDLLCVLGGSTALGASLVAEGDGWVAAFRKALGGAARSVAAHREALAAAGVVGPLPRGALQDGLRRYHRREILRIGMQDLVRRSDVDATIRELSALAEAEIDVATGCTRARLAAEWGDPPVGFVVLGMGKLGGGELNYSSDIDLVYIYEAEGESGSRAHREFFARLAEEVTRALGEVTSGGFCFRVDLRLRPAGEQGLVATSVPAALAYYEAFGQTWERAAWLKARPVGGDRALGQSLLDELEPFVFRRFLDYGTLEDIEAMKRKVDAALRAPAARERDVKLGRGGIREIEFFVQAHQLIHAGKDARLRERATLATLSRLAECDYVPSAQAAGLAAAYRFLRDVEHKLQIVQQRQTQRTPSDPAAELALARRMGFREGGGVAAFDAALAGHTAVVEEAFNGLFRGAAVERQREERPEAVGLVEALDHEEQALWRLSQLGFADLEAAYRDLRLLRDGPPHARASARRKQALAKLAPSLVTELARAPAPDRALRHTATFISTVGARTSFLHLLLENPGVRRLLVRLFAGSEFLSAFFLRHPELLDSLVRADQVRVLRTPAELEAELCTRLAAAPDLETRLDDLRRFCHEEFLRIGLHDVEGEIPVDVVGGQLSAVAEACVRAALEIARHEAAARVGLPDGPATLGLAVIAMGKLGGGEINYNSDLDLIFIYDPGPLEWWTGRTDPHAFFTRVAQRTISALQTPTREGLCYRIDTRLRPSGNQGPLVASLDAFRSYHRGSAALWERQALTKARVVAGPPALAAHVTETVEGFVFGPGLSPAEVAEIARMRERIEHERGGDGSDRVNIKTGRGGLVDVEFLVQMLQLRYGRELPTVRERSTRFALGALGAAGCLTTDEARSLAEGYGFLRAIENRMRLEHDQAVEFLDTSPAVLGPLAHRLGYRDPGAAEHLAQDHDRVRSTVRGLFETVVARLSS